MRADDALKYIHALVTDRIDWACDLVGGGMCDRDHELDLEPLEATVIELRKIVAQFGDPNRYSDGRAVVTSAEIERGFRYEHIWHADISAESLRSLRGHLSPGGPDLPSPGVYEISTDPTTQSIHVRVLRTT